MLLWTINHDHHQQQHQHQHCRRQRPQFLKAPLSSSLPSLAWASALFQMMNPRCIVPLLSLPGRLPILCSSGRRAPWFPGADVLACASSAWQARLRWGRICNNLQSHGTLATEHREIRNESSIGVQFGAKSPESVAAFTYDVNPACQDSILASEWSQWTVHSSGSVSRHSGSIFLPSVVFRAQITEISRRRAAAVAEECYGWRLIHVQPAAAYYRGVLLVRSEHASLWMLGVWGQ
jgi:hypothetical protein